MWREAHYPRPNSVGATCPLLLKGGLAGKSRCGSYCTSSTKEVIKVAQLGYHNTIRTPSLNASFLDTRAARYERVGRLLAVLMLMAMMG